MPEPIQEIAYSRYAARLLAARPELAAELAAAAPADEAALKCRLRRLRQRVLLRVMARDLSGRASLEEVCGTMSDLAELALKTSLEFLRCEDLVVVGMGKLGGRELNVSSDIDLVFLYSGSHDGAERYQRAGRRLTQLLSGPPGAGFVF